MIFSVVDGLHLRKLTLGSEVRSHRAGLLGAMRGEAPLVRILEPIVLFRALRLLIDRILHLLLLQLLVAHGCNQL